MLSGSPDISVLSTSPCLICSDVVLPMEEMKLSAIKLDSRFTTSAQMIKLMGHFEVNRLTFLYAQILIIGVLVYCFLELLLDCITGQCDLKPFRGKTFPSSFSDSFQWLDCGTVKTQFIVT